MLTICFQEIQKTLYKNWIHIKQGFTFHSKEECHIVKLQLVQLHIVSYAFKLQQSYLCQGHHRDQCWNLCFFSTLNDSEHII